MDDYFYIWQYKPEPNAATLVDFEGFEKCHELRKGIAHGHDFPSSVTLRMHPDRPTETILPDNVKNTQNLIVISEKLKSFLEKQELQEIEYLPIQILDHKNRPVEEAFYIVHPINNIDCLDLEKCSPRWSEIDDSIIKKVKTLAIIDERVPKAKKIFRPLYYTARPLIEKQLAEEILANGFTGVQFEPVSEISGRLR